MINNAILLGQISLRVTLITCEYHGGLLHSLDKYIHGYKSYKGFKTFYFFLWNITYLEVSESYVNGIGDTP